MADNAFILSPADNNTDDGAPSSRVVLKHLKSRHGETRDIDLTFNRHRQRFTTVEPSKPAHKPNNGKLNTALRELWARNRPADESEGED